MATHLPRPQASQQPFHLSPNSSPKHFLPIDTQHRRGRDPVNSTLQQPVADSRPNGTTAYGNTSLLVPKGPHAQAANGEAPSRPTMAMNGMPFNTARSPPNAKSTVLFPYMLSSHPDPVIDTSHVPCKFFRLGQCQAGKACPFSHSTDLSSVDTPCKYFAKVLQRSMPT